MFKKRLPYVLILFQFHLWANNHIKMSLIL